MLGTDFFRALKFIMLWMCIAMAANAQKGLSWEDFVEDYVANDERSEMLSSEQLEELTELHASPLNINDADSVALIQLPFLSVQQVHSICSYVRRYGALHTLSELQLIPLLDYRTRNYLSLFVYCGPLEEREDTSGRWRKWINGRHEVVARLDVPLYKRDGYKNYSEEELLQYPNRRYWGNALYHSLRYRYRYRQEIAYGITLEKDAGEPFGADGNYPYDSFTGYVMWQPHRTLYTLVLGNYKLNFGQGLVVGSGFGSFAPSMQRRPNGVSSWLKKHSSVSESDYFQGCAAVFNWNKVFVAPFVSYRSLDANLQGDSVITSFKTDGYHRTQLERSKKNNCTAWAGGVHAAWQNTSFSVGVSAVVTGYSLPLVPRDVLYRKYALRGSLFSASGLDYAYRGRLWNAEGEVACSEKGAWAFCNTIRCYPVNWLSIVSQQRFYSYRYVTPYSFAYHMGSGVQNEEGVYVGMEGRLGPAWLLSASTDWSYFPWATYRTVSASKGGKWSLGIRYGTTAGHVLELSYQGRLQERDRNNADEVYRMQTYRHKLRLQWQTSASENIRWVASLDGICNQTEQNRYGWMASGRFYWKNRTVSLAAASAYYHTDSYDERIYLYEPNLLYAMSFPMCYYRGISEVVTATFRLSRHWHVSCRYKLEHYFNRSVISSGQQKINGPTKQDLSFQLHCLF